MTLLITGHGGTEARRRIPLKKRLRVSVSPWLVVAWVMSSLAPAFAAEWTEFIDKSERFGVNLPGKPEVRDIQYVSWRGATVPARVYTVKDGSRSYSVTVVDYTKVVIHNDTEITDILGSIDWAAWNIRKRPGIQITYDAYAQADRIEGHEIYLVNPDKTKTTIGIFLHAKRLYILEANVPAASPPPLEFQQSLEIFDDQGVRVRYEVDAEGQRLRRVPGGN
jgi:hypothetical protein